MNRSILKPIIAGVLIGAALFFIPFFVLRVVTVVLIVGLLFRLFGRRSWGRETGVRSALPVLLIR